MKKHINQIMADASPEALDRVPVDGIPVPEDVSADRIREKVWKKTGLTPSAAQGGVQLSAPSEAKAKRRKQKKWIPWAAAAASFVLVGAALFALLLRLGGGTDPSGPDDPWQPTLPPAAPWTDGSLSLLTVTYRSSTDTLQTPGFDRLSIPDEYVVTHPVVVPLSCAGEAVTDAVSLPGTQPETEPPIAAETRPEGGTAQPSDCEGENFAVSLLPGTKITDCAGGRLIRVRLSEGEHCDCEGVYYDVQKDEAVCMSCLLRDMLGNGDEYIDACIRSICEDCLLQNRDLGSGEVPDYYGLLTENGSASRTGTRAGKLLASRKTLSIEKLGLDGIVRTSDPERLNDALRRFAYPVVRVLEYGTDLNKCVFMLCSGYQTDTVPENVSAGVEVSTLVRQMPMTYGIYLADLTEGTVTRIDGSSIDRPWFYSHEVQYLIKDPAYYSRPARLLSAVSDFTGVSVNGDYSKLVVTLPWQYRAVDSLNTFSYTGAAVVVLDCTKGGFTVIEQFDSRPVGAAVIQHGVIRYTGMDGRTYFISDGQSFSPDGTFARMALTDRNVPVVIMRGGDAYRFYTADGKEVFFDPNDLPELSGGKNPASRGDAVDVTPEDPTSGNLGRLDVYNRTVMEDGVRVDVVIGRRTELWTGGADVMAVTPDGRFVYRWSLGEECLLCVDTAEGLTGTVALSEDFLAAVAQTDPANDHFLLFTNTAGTGLLLTWYHDGTLTFDREGFMTCRAAINGSEGSNGLLYHVRENLETALKYLRIDGKPVKVRGVSRIVTMAKLLSLDIWEGDFTIIGVREKYVRLVEAVMPYMDFTGQTVEISQATLNAVLNGLPAGDVDSRIAEALGQPKMRDTGWMTSRELEKRKEELNRTAADEIWQLFFGYWPVSSYRDSAFFAAVNEGLDEAYILSAREEIRRYVSENMTFTVLTQEQGNKTVYRLVDVDLRPERLYEITRELAETYTGMTWGGFVSAAPFLHRPWAEASFVGRTDDTLHDVRLSQLYMIDAHAMGGLLSGLTFEEGSADIHIRAELDFLFGQGLAGVYDRLTGSIAVGYDENGQGWAVSGGWRAPMSGEEVEAFYAICRTEKVVPWMRNADTYYEETHRSTL